MPLVPAPPGAAVAFEDSAPARFSPPHTSNRFIVGTFDRGDVGQVSDLSAARKMFGGHVNYSSAPDAVAVLLALGVRTVSIARVVGPAATAATVTLDAKIKITAKSAGEWANGATGGLDAAIVDVAGSRRIVIRENDLPVATSPASPDQAGLIAWSDANDVVTVETVAPGLPAVTAAANLAGGTDDRANIGPADYGVALAKLDRRWGPGHILAPGVSDPDVHGLLLEHGEINNRNPHLDLTPTVTEGDALAHALAVQADHPATIKRAGLWASWSYVTPVAGEPERLLPRSAVQSGIASRVEQVNGIGAAPFGHELGTSAIESRLFREWSTGYNPPGEAQRLYAGQVNVALDDGVTIAAEGYRTLDPDPVYEDLHVADTRMRLAWQAETRARTFIGKPVTRQTLGSLHGSLIGLCEEFRAAGAFNDIGDVGYRVIVDELNTTTTMAARELHGRIRFRPTGSTHWIDVLVGSIRPTETV
ncbi:hypothetical protein PAI11_37560 [Patulibacter medicamentivorans]|uniref:Tail sheath protein subtilisin-like domain-containing protein n=1 Tax=Patulibacter medicamentivorans TaxID=1097667 RepID=H0EA82_9ACTN|nr:hypothetical protein [Patulibacter medicamentivorans]EHN09422.1 hypothetical protein PAI11_37560 [Patulibacter medicamentivorans]